MEITRDACIQQLHDEFIYDFSQSEDISKLTRNARNDNKGQCLEQVSPMEIEGLLEGWKQTEKQQERPKVQEDKPKQEK